MTRRSFQARLAFTLTWRCNLRCRHCLSGDTLSRPANVSSDLDMPSAEMDKWIDEAGRSGKIRTLSFTGGEPFLVYENLITAVARASRQGLSTTVVTNAYWASSLQRARAYLSPLEGLGVLKISTDQFHQEFVPLDRVRNAVQAAAELGLRVLIKFCYLDRETELAALERQLDGLIAPAQINAEPVYKLGRAAHELEPHRFLNCDLDQPCVLADVPIVHPDGSVYACCGPTFTGPGPLFLGNLYRHSLMEILEASETNVLLHVLRLWGPWHLWQLLQQEYGKELGGVEPDRTSMCSFCFDLMTNVLTQRLLLKKAGDPQLVYQTASGRLLLLGEEMTSIRSMSYVN